MVAFTRRYLREIRTWLPALLIILFGYSSMAFAAEAPETKAPEFAMAVVQQVPAIENCSEKINLAGNSKIFYTVCSLSIQFETRDTQPPVSHCHLFVIPGRKYPSYRSNAP